MLEDDSQNREVHGYLQYLTATLLAHAGALKYTATSNTAPLRYDDIVVVSALAFPCALPWCPDPARSFLDLDAAMCRRIVTFAAENHVRVQSFIKTGESFSRRQTSSAVNGQRGSEGGGAGGGGTGAGGGSHAAMASAVEQTVESILLLAAFLCGRALSYDALLVDLDECSGALAKGCPGGGRGGPVIALRMELHRALTNFLLRHMFFRMDPDAEQLRKLPKPLFIHIDLLKARPVPRFVPGALPLLPPALLHDIKSSEDAVVHALMNVYGYAVRGVSQRGGGGTHHSQSPSPSRKAASTAGGTHGASGSSASQDRAAGDKAAGHSLEGRASGSRSPGAAAGAAAAGSPPPGGQLLLPVASLSTIPNERSEWFTSSAGPTNWTAFGDGRDSSGGWDGGESAMAGNEAEEEQDDGPAVCLDGGLPWLQLMDDLKFLAPHLEVSLGSTSTLDFPVALNFSTLSPAEAVMVQLADGPAASAHTLLSAPCSRGGSGGEPEAMRSGSTAALRCVRHYGSALLSVGLERVRIGGGAAVVPGSAAASGACAATYPVSAEYVGDVFRIQTTGPSSPPVPEKDNAVCAMLSETALREHFSAFGVVQSLPSAILVTAHNICGLAAAAVWAQQRSSSSSGGVVRGSTEIALDEVKRLLVELAEASFERISPLHCASSTSPSSPLSASSAAIAALAAARPVAEGQQAVALLHSSDDVLEALSHCGADLTAPCRNAVFLRNVLLSLKCIVEARPVAAAPAPAPPLPPQSGSGRRAAALHALTAIRAVRVLAACGAVRVVGPLPGMMVAEGAALPSLDGRRRYNTPDSPAISSGSSSTSSTCGLDKDYDLVLVIPDPVAAKTTSPGDAAREAAPKAAALERDVSDVGTDDDTYSDHARSVSPDSYHRRAGDADRAGNLTTCIYIRLDRLAAELRRQQQWLRLREVPCDEVEAALRELSSLPLDACG